MQRKINAQEPKLVSPCSSPPAMVQTKLYFDGAPEVYFLIGSPNRHPAQFFFWKIDKMVFI